MSDLKLFRIDNGQVVELRNAAVALERQLQTLIERNMEPLFGVRFLASEFPTGPRHGGATARAFAFLRQARHAPDLAVFVSERWQRGDEFPGFGHALYPHGDPRGAELLAQIRQRPALPEKLSTLHALVEQVETLTGQHPNIDLMLAAIIEAHELDASAALALFAAGRVAGWLAHALEQQGQSSLIRPRARYVGNEAEPPM